MKPRRIIYLAFFAVMIGALPARAEVETTLMTRLSDTEDRPVSAGVEARMRLKGALGPQFRFLADLRAAGRASSSLYEEDSAARKSARGFVEIRQAYLEYRAGDLRGKAGRQRLREETGLWWNRDIEAVTASWKAGACRLMGGAGQQFSTWRTGMFNALRADEQDIARLFGEVSCAYRAEHKIEWRMMGQHDASGRAALGATDDVEDPNDRDGLMLWTGLRMVGNASGMTYRVDLMGRAGQEKVNDMTAGGVVTGARARDVAGWAADAAVDIPVNEDVAVQARYSYASGGDRAEGHDASFRQTGLHRNLFDARSLSYAAEGFGLALRPELSNLHIAALGLTRRFLDVADAGVAYRSYWLDRETGDVYTADGRAHAGWQGRTLGDALDLQLNIDLARAFHLDWDQRRLSLRTAAGVFRQGAAYGVTEGDVASRWLAELRLSF